MRENLATGKKKVIKPLSISEDLLEIMKEGIYEVHSTFASGINLKLDQILCFAGNKNHEKLPYGILIKKEDCRNLIQASRLRTSYYSEKDQVLFLGDSVLDFNNPIVHKSRLKEKYSYLTNDDIKYIRQLSDRQCFRDWEKDTEIYTGIFAHLRRGIQSTKRDEILFALRHCVGCGPGLTPAGDDILIGLLHVHHLFPFLFPEFIKQLELLTLQRYTTDVSISNYVCTFRGLFCESLLGFAESLKAHDINGIKRCMERILKFGYSSGRDLTAGLYLGFEFLLTQRNH